MVLEYPSFDIKGSLYKSSRMLLQYSGAQIFALLPFFFAICIVGCVSMSLSVEPAFGRSWETVTSLEPGVGLQGEWPGLANKNARCQLDLN